jgi:opacity protein-like surface antigen
MKKLLFITVLALFAIPNIQAQENAIKVNPLAILGGTDLVSYERALSDNTSGVISVGYGGFKFGDVSYKSIGGGLQYRYYFDEALKGWYLAASVGYQSGDVEAETITIGGSSVDSDKFNFTALGVGVKAGYQWLWDSGFTLELNLGASYKSFKYDFENDSEENLYNFKASGVLPTFGFGLGYAF